MPILHQCNNVGCKRVINKNTKQLKMLTEAELNRIYSWLPYRESWIVDKSGQVAFYEGLIQEITSNQKFECFFSQDGGTTNYLEFYCYPINHKFGKLNSIIVCVSLCAPIAAYGQSTIDFIDIRTIGHEFLKIENINSVFDKKLLFIEQEIKAILGRYDLYLIDKDFANRELPRDIFESMENLNEGSKILNGLFQWTD